MGVVEQIITAVLLAASVGAVALLITAFRIPADAPAARFRSGWLGAFGLMLGLASCTGLAGVLAQFGIPSAAGAAAAVALNVVVQPLALLMCWTGIRKMALGLRGQVGYAWRLVPESELAAVPPAQRKQLSRYCVFQGVLVLPLGACISLGCASPLVRLFV